MECTEAPEGWLKEAEDFAPLSDHALRPIVRALAQLSPQSQELVVSLLRQLADRGGINVAIGPAPRLQTPAEGISLWMAKLKSERYAERTVETYHYFVKQYLKHDPTPTNCEFKPILLRGWSKCPRQW